MRITLGWSTIGTFEKEFYRKFKLRKFDFYSKEQREMPMVMFGYYIRDDQQTGILLERILTHTGLLVIVWSGSDSMNLNKKMVAINYFKKNKHRIFHIAHSHWIKSDLEAVGLDVIDRVVFPVTFEMFNFHPSHDGYIYHYHPRSKSRYEVYGTDIVNELEKRKKIQFVKTCYGHLDRWQLAEMYQKCAFGIRLTDHDNMALSCVELGLMGRPSIFNGNIPGAIHYESKEEAVRILKEMYKNKPEPSKELAEEMREFVYDDMSWLNLNNYD